MGQAIQILSRTVLETTAIFATDRGVTGQDGYSFSPSDGAGGDFPSRLAGQIFAADDAIEHVLVVSNQVVVRRNGGWDDASLEAAAAVISGLFVYYDRADS